MRRWTILALALSFPTAAIAAGGPAALAQVAGGMWEVSGIPGTQTPMRLCVADILRLAQFEHRDRNCTRTVLSDNGSSAVISYSCSPANFGQSQVDVITPRALRISTQGISSELPFNYVLQARRVGDCAKSGSSSRH